jgi:hypothetical protein
MHAVPVVKQQRPATNIVNGKAVKAPIESAGEPNVNGIT